MPDFIADQMADIHANLHKITKEENRMDTDWRTATGGDLDAIGETYSVRRETTYESDGILRSKIEAQISKRLKR